MTIADRIKIIETFPVFSERKEYIACCYWVSTTSEDIHTPYLGLGAPRCVAVILIEIFFNSDYIIGFIVNGLIIIIF